MGNGVKATRPRVVRQEQPSETTAQNEARFRAQLEQNLNEVRTALSDLNLRMEQVLQRLDDGGL